MVFTTPGHATLSAWRRFIFPEIAALGVGAVLDFKAYQVAKFKLKYVVLPDSNKQCFYLEGGNMNAGNEEPPLLIIPGFTMKAEQIVPIVPKEILASRRIIVVELPVSHKICYLHTLA